MGSQNWWCGDLKEPCYTHLSPLYSRVQWFLGVVLRIPNPLFFNAPKWEGFNVESPFAIWFPSILRGAVLLVLILGKTSKEWFNDDLPMVESKNSQKRHVISLWRRAIFCRGKKIFAPCSDAKWSSDFWNASPDIEKMDVPLSSVGSGYFPPKIILSSWNHSHDHITSYHARSQKPHEARANFSFIHRGNICRLQLPKPFLISTKIERIPLHTSSHLFGVTSPVCPFWNFSAMNQGWFQNLPPPKKRTPPYYGKRDPYHSNIFRDFLWFK